MTSISNFGQSGPYRDFKTSDILVYSMGGEMNSTGLGGREPVKLGANVALYQAGSVAAVASAGALFLSLGDGPGQQVDVAIMETQTGSIDRRMSALIAYQYTGETSERASLGASGFPVGVYPCADGYMEVTGGLTYLPRVVQALGNPSELLEPRWYTSESQADPELKSEFDTHFLPWTLEHTKQKAWREAQIAGVLTGPLNTMEDLANDQHSNGRDAFAQIDHPASGSLKYPGRPFIMSESPWEAQRPAPMLGQHNREILQQLGHSAEDVVRLRTRRHLRFDEQISAEWCDRGLVSRLPLEGIRVLDMTVVWAGPYCTSFLADLGAEVIRVESLATFAPLTRGVRAHPTREQLQNLALFMGGYPDRQPGDRPWNRCPVFNAHARNKSMTVDLSRPSGMEIVKDLVRSTDIFVENNVVDRIDRLGINYDMLKELKEDIIMLRMPAFGTTGPYRDFRALGVHIEGVIGHSLLRGYADMDPSANTPVYMADAAGGTHGAFAVLADLHHRRRTGKGQYIELGQAEAAVPMVGQSFMDYTMNGRSSTTMGNRHPTAVQGCYRCAGNGRGDDRWVCITIHNDEEWR